MHKYRSHTCGELRKSHAGETIRLSGWVNRIRDHGGLLFIDLRDHYGITQIVVNPDSEFFPLAETIRSEWVVTVTGTVIERVAAAINPKMDTGEIEIGITGLEIQSAAKELALPVFGELDYPEDTRLKYRFLDLRRERIHNNIVRRSQIISSMRKRMVNEGFTEYQTPILTASSPEGARDFLVPARMHPGKYYALPQAPQQFKQLAMVAGFDRYFQIAPCFRDEDPRADRALEFYQLDIEMSFVTQEDIFQTIEPVLRGIFEEFADGKSVTKTFPRIPYLEAMLKYGSDKPDLRNPIEIVDVTDQFGDDSVSFKAFKGIVASGGSVRAIPAPGAASKPRSFFDKMNDWARKDMGAAGLGYIIFDEIDGEIVGRGPIAKFIPAEIQAQMVAKAGINGGDALFFAAGKTSTAATLAGAARDRIGHQLGLIDETKFELCWIVDFPMYEFDEKEDKLDFSHNPFSMPQGGLEALENQDPLDILGYQYDIVCNGFELSSGAVRNHKPEIMYKAFELVGYDKAFVDENFGGMIRAFEYGAPPHGGLAPGIDRIVMLLCGEENLREVTMFAMNQQAEDLLMGAPANVSPKQLRELHVRSVMPEVKKEDKKAD
ncbi:MAG: aspartate--tRNA ligase [Rhizobiales bacterium]|nr:aspartate--tRNA ligase [Hyphomicrobiales bacterium]NRB12972.1 aspartate--tRNA ligase [Hyphomicrobiales bacterium]